MPSLITHYLFARDVVSSLKNPMLSKNIRFVENGAQGPDFLFYHNAAPSRFRAGSSRLRKLGSLVHSEKTNDFYRSALKTIAGIKDPLLKEEVIAYTAGHLCHWALDSAAHPYIYARCGWGSLKASSAHHHLESTLDAILLKTRCNESIETFDPSVICVHDSKKDALISASVYVPATRRLWNLDLKPDEIFQAWKDFRSDQKLFHDPKGSKIRFTRLFDSITLKPDLISGFFIPGQIEDNEDACNLLHKTWISRADHQEYSDSFFDLYDQALKRAHHAVSLFQKACSHREYTDEFLLYLGNRDYEKGTDPALEA